MPTQLVLVVQLDASDPPARLGEWLEAAGLDLDVRALDEGQALPADLSEHGAVVVMGGAMGAWDDESTPYLPAVRELLRRAVAEEVPTLAVCLGYQLLAAANGGTVRPMPDGPEVGAQLVAKRTAAATDPLFATLPITPDVIQWHHDEVSQLPPGAVHLASSPACENQAFRLGRLAWGVQFHIESTPDMVREWAATDPPEGWDTDLLLERADAVQDDLAEVWAPFAATFAGIARDPAAVPPPRGVRTSTAAPITDPAAIRAALAAEANTAHGGGSHGVLPFPQRREPDA